MRAKKMVFVILTSILCLPLSAQFKVNSDGKVHIGDSNPEMQQRLNIYAVGGSAIWASVVQSADWGDATKVTLNREQGCAFSVYLKNSLGGSSKTMMITGDGKLRAPAYYNYSDSILKSDIRSMESVSDKLFRLQGISYIPKSDVKAQKVNAKRAYGFVAQEVEKVYPDLVHEDGDGIKAVSYVEMIPLLLEALKEKSALIDQLSDRVAQLEQEATAVSFRSETTGTQASHLQQAVLFQNDPNPFTHTTQIRYALPVNAASATIYIYNMQGVQIEEYPLQKQSEYLNISAGKLQPAMYLYALVVDGEIIDTKKMIVTN
ncbi:tail fiber domain-containing protein [Parabacteroides sp. OttesenSCG-928-N08]|nr:tail fiber domain-containing protein [Parabacteroides sp. OttesenSCG-928-N08]